MRLSVLLAGFLEPGDVHSCPFFVWGSIGPLLVRASGALGTPKGSWPFGTPLGHPPRPPGLGFPLGRSWVCVVRFHDGNPGSGSNRFGSDRFPVNRSPVSGSGLGSRASCPFQEHHDFKILARKTFEPPSGEVRRLIALLSVASITS